MLRPIVAVLVSRWMKGYIAHTDRGWWDFLRERRQGGEVNFWRPRNRPFSALAAGEPFFFRLKAPINRIGGFGLFTRYDSLHVWRAWEVFGLANGVEDEATLLDHLARLARRPVRLSDPIGCIAVADCTFFELADLLEVPDSFNPQNLSGSVIDLDNPGGRTLWARCLERAAAAPTTPEWLPGAVERQRRGQPQLIIPRLGQGSFRLAVMEAYGGGCAITGEHARPALEAAHIRPWSRGGRHTVSNGLLLRRDVHRLFDLGYVSARADRRFLVSPLLRTEFADGRTYYALEGQLLRLPDRPDNSPSPELLEWHSETVFQSS